MSLRRDAEGLGGARPLKYTYFICFPSLAIGFSLQINNHDEIQCIYGKIGKITGVKGRAKKYRATQGI